MIFNASIDADDPRRVALILAEIIGGRAGPFAAIGEGSWVAVAGDGFGTMIEVYPRGTELHRAPAGLNAYGLAGMPRGNGAFHLTLGTELSAAQIHAIGTREGWPTKYCRRGGAFGVIELWIDDRLMVEVLTAEMQREYLDWISIAALAELGAGAVDAGSGARVVSLFRPGLPSRPSARRDRA